MLKVLKFALFAGAFLVLCQNAIGSTIFNIALGTGPLVGHPAGPFYVYVEFVDGSGIGDANNTVTLGNFEFSGGNSLGNPMLFGGVTGSMESGISMTDSSFIDIFSEQFLAGQQLSFTLGFTSNDDAGGTPDAFTFFVLDSSGVPIPTLAPAGNYFLTVALGSSGPVFSVFGSNPSRPLSVGGPVNISAPTVSLYAAPEPALGYLVPVALGLFFAVRRPITLWSAKFSRLSGNSHTGTRERRAKRS